MARSIAGWKVDRVEREELLARFAPRYPRTIADHVTLRFGTGDGTPTPTANAGEIVGEADDGAGVQALVVRIGGTTERGDGSHFHITWSLAARREAKESNDVIREHGWRPIEPPVAILLEPARWKG
ncbi:hypothetical protein [Sphingobium sp. B2]|uniref:hypothetical protein n=1 Tax=Sphingobium sp. B2 TaxID=2583228 RepID=UPI0011A2AF10|nr:hypothetical protein [Sphingobium sp. B2]